jgi:hypothetical protein
VNLVVAVFIWVMIYPMMIQIDWHAVKDVGKQAARAAADTGRELADQAVHDGRARRAVLPAPVRALGRSAVGQRIHCRHDPARRGAVHRDGVRVEPAGEGRRQLHPGAGVGERPHHGVRLRTDRRLPAGRHQHHRAMGNPGAVHRALRGAAAAGRHGDAACAGRRSSHAVADFVAAQAVVRRRPDRHRGAAVRLPGQHHRGQAAGDRDDRGAADRAELRHLRHRHDRRQGAEAAAQRRRPRLPDRHLELLRAGGGGGDLAVRPELRRGARDRGRRAGRGAGDAVAGGDSSTAPSTGAWCGARPSATAR